LAKIWHKRVVQRSNDVRIALLLKNEKKELAALEALPPGEIQHHHIKVHLAPQEPTTNSTSVSRNPSGYKLHDK
jgi:hypothetical protein